MIVKVLLPIIWLVFPKQTLASWRIVFFLASGIYVSTVIIFTVFGRTSTQPWNTYWEVEHKQDNVNKNDCDKNGSLKSLDIFCTEQY